MKMYKEITLENLGELESIISEVKAEANEKKDYIQKAVILIGKEAIEKAIEKYHISCYGYKWEDADRQVQHLKIDGTAKFVYVAYVEIYWNALTNRGDVEINYIKKVISCNGYLLSAYTKNYGKVYSFELFNEMKCYGYGYGVTVEKPNRVGILTDKKADAWLSALLDEAKKRQEARKAADDRKAAFMERMAKLTKRPASTFEKKGTLFLGMFIVEWGYSISGQAYTRIEIDPSSRNEKGELMNDTERLSILADCGLLG